jgi:hypothetical protein
MDAIFDGFTRQLEEKKVITYSGSIIDATFVDTPRQRNSRAENRTIKEGGVPGEWEKEETNTRGGKRTRTRGGRRKTTKYITGLRIM